MDEMNTNPVTETPAAMRARVKTALTLANNAPFTVKPIMGGCARIYVSVSSTNGRKVINAIAKACGELGLIFQRTAYYGMKNAIYIGYDNADGRAYAKGEAFAATLNSLGIKAYLDTGSD